MVFAMNTPQRQKAVLMHPGDCPIAPQNTHPVNLKDVNFFITV